MPPSRSAGLLLYRGSAESLEVLLVHPGGPLWARKDAGAWSIPKGEFDTEDPLEAACREFAEELGHPAPGMDGVLDLGEVRQRAGKVVRAFAVAGDLDVTAISSNTFTMQWPPRSGRMAEFPEVDRAGWFGPAQAREKLNPAQAPLVDRLITALSS